MSLTSRDELDIAHAAASDACVLLTGDPADSTALAYQIHRLSGRRDGEFVVVDCASPAHVVEQHLDAWLDAGTGRSNLHATPAATRTVLLKEVGRLQPRLQRKLAAALAAAPSLAGRRRQRLMASTGESLARRIDEGTFDDELFYRLNVIHMVLPDGRRQRSMASR